MSRGLLDIQSHKDLRGKVAEKISSSIPKGVPLRSHLLLVLFVASLLTACGALKATTPTKIIATAVPSATYGMTSTSLPEANATSTMVPTPVPASMATPTAPACTIRSDWMTYTVQAGDTLSQLAIDTNTSVEALMQANCLLIAGISAGQEMLVPVLPVLSSLPTTPTGVILADCSRSFHLSAWQDLDGDGLWDTSELPLADVKFELQGMFMQIWGYPYLSNADGQLTIETLTPGRCDVNDYTITAMPPESYEPTTPASVTFTNPAHEVWQCGFRTASK